MSERKERTESVRLPKSIIESARVLAKAEGRTLSGMIAHAYMEFLECIRLPKSVIERARILAKAEGRTIEGMITHAFEEFLFWREHIKQFVKWLADKQVKELPPPEDAPKDDK